MLFRSVSQSRYGQYRADGHGSGLVFVSRRGLANLVFLAGQQVDQVRFVAVYHRIVAGSKAFHADGSLSKFFDAIQQFQRAEGLDEIVVGSAAHALFVVTDLAACGNHDDSRLSEI